MTRKFKPDRTNRAESVNEIWSRFDLVSGGSASLDRRIGLFEHYLAAQKLTPAIGASLEIANSATWIAIGKRWLGAPNEVDSLRRAFALFYWHVELALAERETGAWAPDSREDALYALLQWQGLAAASGEAWFVEWVAPYLESLFASGSVTGSSLHFSRDTPARLFTETILKSLVTGEWPAIRDSEPLGAYASLLTTARNPSQFAQALIEYCDYRVAQCFGYDGIDATVRRRPSQDQSVLDLGDWDQVFPVELFSLKLAFERATGLSMKLDEPHPLLQTRLMMASFPALTPLYQDELSLKFQALFKASFGERPLCKLYRASETI